MTEIVLKLNIRLMDGDNNFVISLPCNILFFKHARGNIAKTNCLIKRNISPVGEVFLSLESVKLLRC